MKNGIVILNIFAGILFMVAALNSPTVWQVLVMAALSAVSWRSAFVIAQQAEQLEGRRHEPN